MMIAATLLLKVEVTQAAPPLKEIECYCTDSWGSRRELGDMVCLEIGSRRFLARCEMSLNNPIWREVSDACVGV
ncbi:MAG: hypothetical protein AAGI50_15455 [Pseudomonadota bacterium]